MHHVACDLLRFSFGASLAVVSNYLSMLDPVDALAPTSKQCKLAAVHFALVGEQALIADLVCMCTGF